MRRWIKRIVIALVVVGLPATAFWFYAAWQGGRELREAIAELDELGEPWRWDELEAARSKITPRDDVRDLIVGLHGKVPRGFDSRKSVEKALDRPSNAAILPEDYEAFDEAMREVAGILDEARKLADMPHGRFYLPWPEDQAWPNTDEVQKARWFIFILQCGAAWHAQQGDLDRAMEDCLAMQRLTQALQEELTLISQLVRIALQAIAVHGTERVVAQGQPAAQQLERLQKAWEQFETQHALRQGFVGERAGSHRLFEALESGKERINTFTAGGKGAATMADSLAGVPLVFNLKNAHAWTLRYMTEVVQTLDIPESERSGRWEELEQKVRKAPGIARLLTPAIQKVFDANRRGDAQVRSLIAGLAAERFRLDHENQWPKTLAELTPKYLARVPDDPYTGRPLQLRPTDDGIVIYSVGPDGKQFGNYQEITKAKGFAIKYEFRLWNVASRRQIIAKEP